MFTIDGMLEKRIRSSTVAEDQRTQLIQRGSYIASFQNAFPVLSQDAHILKGLEYGTEEYAYYLDTTSMEQGLEMIFH